MKYLYEILNKKKFILCEINAFLLNLSVYLLPVALAYFTAEPFNLQKFEYLIIAVIGLVVLKIITDHIWYVYIDKCREDYARKIQISYFKRLLNMKMYKLNNIHNGYIKKQIDVVAEESKNFSNIIFSTGNGFIIAVTVFLAMLYIQNIAMFGIAIIFIIIIVVYNYIMGKATMKTQEQYNDGFATYNSTYVDFLQNIKSIKRLDANDYAIEKSKRQYKSILPKMKKLFTLQSLRVNGAYFLVYVMFILVLIDLYFKMRSGENILSYLLFYTVIFADLNLELRYLSELFLSYTKLKAATNKMEEVLEEDTKEEVIKNWNQITIKDVHFKYGDDMINEISIPYININKKDKICITGKSGQGKTTFLNILAKDLPIDKGQYLIDDKAENKRLDIAYISQEVELFDLSIRDNLCLGKEISDDVLNKYIQEAGLEEVVSNQAQGLDEIVGEKGTKLSTGQKQRINIIRSILLDKDIYILDEPTSNLDKQTEEKIANLIEKYLKDKTVIIVTHRDEIKRVCDKEYNFENNTMYEIK